MLRRVPEMSAVGERCLHAATLVVATSKRTSGDPRTKLSSLDGTRD